MKEISWYGRGGQGAFTASRLLGIMGMLGGRFALAFPSFGPERRGAPIKAYTKISERPIRDRSVIPLSDYIIVLDDSLYADALLSELKPEGKLLLNTADEGRFQKKASVITVNASSIAEEILGRPISNTAMLGILPAIDGNFTIEQAKTAISDYMPSRMVKKNIALVEAVYECVQGQLQSDG